jgi:choline dehydrogenase-like flavoprotein
VIIGPERAGYGEVRKGVDFAIIGSGSAGSLLGYYLARAGFSVAVLERGAHYAREEILQREVLMMSRLGSPTTFQPTSGGHTRVAILQGRCYGGSTILCDGVSWDLPMAVRDDWEAMGLASFSPGNKKLDGFERGLRRQMNIKPVKPEYHNRNNQLLKIACDRAGLECVTLERNVKFCLRCGFCAQGCRYGAKMDAARTFLKWSQKYGADVYTGCDVERILVNYSGEDDLDSRRKLDSMSLRDRELFRTSLKRSKAEHGEYKFKLECSVGDMKSPRSRGEKPERKPLTVHSRYVIVSAGAIGSSRLLLRSKINPNGRVGKRFTLHPTAFFHALHSGLVIDAFDGINNSYECTHFAYHNREREYYDSDRHGFFLEASFSQPWGLANILPGGGEGHLRLMRNFRRFQGMQVNVKSDSFGEVTEDEVRYDISERDNEALVFGSKLAVRLMLKAGAREVYTGVNDAVIKSGDDVDPAIDNVFRGRKVGYMSKQALLHTGHPFGGNVMGADPESSVVDETCESHHIKGLYVCDASVFPTSIGVNPHLSISIVARKTADHLLSKYGSQGGKGS